MALSKTEQETLAVLRYINERRSIVRALIKKIYDEADGDISIVTSRTGFTNAEAVEMLKVNQISTPVKTAPKKKNPIAEKNINRRVFSKADFPSTLAGSAAFEMYNIVWQEYKKGEQFMQRREAMQRLQLTNATAMRAMALLARKGILDSSPGRTGIVNI